MLPTRQLGNTGLRLSTIGLGTWALGGGDWKFSWGPQDDAESVRTIHRALELGVNWIDTAAVYGLGHAEEVVGRALRGLRERPLIATKCERCWDEQGRIIPRLKKESVRAEVEGSLRRLRVEAIDLYQIHWPQPDEDIEEAWEAIAGLIRAGKVRFGGVSNFSVRELQRVQPIHPVASLQPPYSMLVRDVEPDLMPYCAANGIGIIAYSPMQKGLLTGKVTRQWVASLPADDHRRSDPKFQEPQLSANLALVEALRKIAAGCGKTVPQLAIAWVLRRPEVTAAIVGARRPDQIEQTIAGGQWQLSEAEIVAIEELLRDSR
jgi:aryl-alcohol dehydrogenase-like predicted oxidoreductase